MIICNELYKVQKFALIQKDADLLYGILLCEWKVNLWKQEVQLHRKWETANMQLENQWE